MAAEDPVRSAGRRQVSIDIGRYLLLLGVMALHLPWQTLPPDSARWLVVSKNLSHIAVPVYFVTAGYFLSWQSRSYWRCLTQPFIRLVPLYLFWLGVYLLIFLDWAHPRLGWSLHDLLSGGPAYHLWFLPALLIGLIVVGVASRAIGRWGALAICVAMATVGLSKGAFHDLLALPGPAQRAGVFMAPMFIWLGTAVRSFALERVDRRMIWAVVALLLVMLGIENAAISYASTGDVLVVQIFPLMMFPTSVAVFMAIRSIPATVWPQWMVDQSQWMFGVYVVHVIAIGLIAPYIVPQGPGSFVLLLIAVFVASSVMARLIAQVPPLRRFVS